MVISNTVEIANPAEGGSCYTSLKRAKEFVLRRHAKWEGVNRIRLLPIAEQIRARQEIAENWEIGRHRGGMVFWNGPDRRPWAMRKPGEVRS